MSTNVETKITQPVEIEIDPARLAHGQWCARRGKTIGTGDVAASYSADRIAEGKPIRKPFEWRGETWVKTSGCGDSATVYRVVDPGLFPGAAKTYDERVSDGDASRADPNGFDHCVTVRYGKRDWVLCGPPVVLVPGKTEQLELF